MQQILQRYSIVWKDCWIYQHVAGYRFNRDSVVLARSLLNLAHPHHRLMRQPPKQLQGVDLGAGSGILSLLLLRDCLAAGVHRADLPTISAVEVQASLVELLEKNSQENGFQESLAVVHADWRQLTHQLPSENFDFVICNPPYYPKEAGLLNKNSEKAIARHFLCGDCDDLVAATARLLKPAGDFYLIYNYAHRQTLFDSLARFGMHIKRLRYVRSVEKSTPQLLLLHVVKEPVALLEFLPPLIYRNEHDARAGDQEEAHRLFYAV